MGASTDSAEAVVGGSELVREALELLARKHGGEKQRVNGAPYVEHPVAVARDVGDAGFEPETVAAALLHDIVEDSDLTVDDVRGRFGERVASLVDAMTDDAEVEPYERRKALHRERVAAAGPEAAAIFAADKLSNVRTLRSAYAEAGEQVAERFDQPLETKLGVWEADAEMASRHPSAAPFADRLRKELAALKADRLSRS